MRRKVERTSISIDPDMMAWARRQAADNPAYRSVSHVVEGALRALRAQIEDGRP